MAVFLDRIDAAPIANSEFDMQFLQWLWVLVDSLNENLSDIQTALNFLTAVNYTAIDIAQLEDDGLLGDGVLLYDITANVYVGKQNGALVQFTTIAYP